MFIQPLSFALTGLAPQNGSDANGGCPQLCVLSNTVCNCTGQTIDLSGITLINGVVPTFEAEVPGVWASDLYTLLFRQNSYYLGFRFDINMTFLLREEELYLFFCPSWNNPQQSLTINVYSSPNFLPPSGHPPLGNVKFSDEV